MSLWLVMERFCSCVAVTKRILLQGWPVNQPDIIVSTPAALLNNIDPKKHRQLNFLRAVNCVVFPSLDSSCLCSFLRTA